MSTNPRTDYEDLKLYLEIKRLKEENVALEKELAEPKWKTGHPEHENRVLVYVRYSTGAVFYETDNWLINKKQWRCYKGQGEVLGWKEIEPFDLEVGE